MEQTKNVDLLIAKMADPVLYKKICLLYDKKQTFKYKHKADVHNGGGQNKRNFFDEREECRKILDFVGNQDVTTVITKQETVAKVCTEFSPGKYVKNYVDAAKKSHEMSDCFHKQRQASKHSSSDFSSKHVSSISHAIVPSKLLKEERGNEFSSEGKLSLKSSLTDVTTLSSDSSEDEIDLIRKSTLYKCKAGGIKHEKKSFKSCAKNKPSEVSNGSVEKKSKCKTVLQDAHISPQKILSKRRENELSGRSDSDEPCSNRKRIRKKCAKENNFSTTSSRNDDLLNLGISTPYPQFTPVFSALEQDDIITVSSESSVSSGADTFQTVKDEKSPVKLKVLKNGRKISKRYPKSFGVNKPSNISKTVFCKSNSKSIRNDSVVNSSDDDDVCLLDSSNLSKSDAFPTTKEHTSSKLPSVKDRYILEKKNSRKIVERSHKLRVPNSTTLKKSNSRIDSAESNVSSTEKNKTFENVENCSYDQNCSSDCAETIENVDEPLFNSGKSYLENFDKTTMNKNRKKDNSERLTNLKTLTGSNAFNSTKSRNNSEYSFINGDSDISSNVLSNSDLASNELHSSSDDDVLFQGFYKAVDSCTNDEGYKSSENETVSQKDAPFNLQSNNLKNPNKVDNETKHGNANDDRSFARSSSSKIDSLEKNVGEANFAREVSCSDFIHAKPSELKIKKIDLIPEPVNFEIPLLHEYEHVYALPKEHIAKLKEHGLSTGKKGRFTPEEDEILKKNVTEFSMEYGISDPAKIFGIHSDHQRDSTVREFLKAKHFYVRLGKNLNDRTLRSIYYRARILYHPLYSSNNHNWTSAEISKLKELQKFYGNNWNKIGQLLKRRSDICSQAFSRYSKKAK